MDRMTAATDPMSPKIVQPSLVLPVNFNAIILIAFFHPKFVMETMTAMMNPTNNFAMTTHAYQNNSSVQADFMRMEQLVRDFVSQWKKDVIERLIVQMGKMKMHVHPWNVLKIISNAQITNASQMFGFVTEMMIVVITQMNCSIVRQEIAQLTNSNVPLAVAFL